MFRRILALFVAFPLGAILIAIAVSNRQPVALILDPFASPWQPAAAKADGDVPTQAPAPAPIAPPTGAVSDLEHATNIARNMVTRYGMSQKLGPLTFGKKAEMVFLGRELSTHKDYSEQTAVLIDQEVRAIVEEADEAARVLLRDNVDKLKLLANTLIERESIDGDEMDRVLRGEKLEPVRKYDDEPAPPGSPAADKPETPSGGQLDAFGGPEPNPAGA